MHGQRVTEPVTGNPESLVPPDPMLDADLKAADFSFSLVRSVPVGQYSPAFSRISAKIPARCRLTVTTHLPLSRPPWNLSTSAVSANFNHIASCFGFWDRFWLKLARRLRR
jgi:hypothetical protein